MIVHLVAYERSASAPTVRVTQHFRLCVCSLLLFPFQGGVSQSSSRSASSEREEEGVRERRATTPPNTSTGEGRQVYTRDFSVCGYVHICFCFSLH